MRERERERERETWINRSEDRWTHESIDKLNPKYASEVFVPELCLRTHFSEAPDVHRHSIQYRDCM